jgi:hypothetical protein
MNEFPIQTFFMENKHPEGTDAFRFAAGKEKHSWMRRLSVALQKGNAITFDAYCEWRNTEICGCMAKRFHSET